MFIRRFGAAALAAFALLSGSPVFAQGDEQYAASMRDRLKGRKQLFVASNKADGSRAVGAATARNLYGARAADRSPREVEVGGETLTVVEIPVATMQARAMAAVAADEPVGLTPVAFAVTPEAESNLFPKVARNAGFAAANSDAEPSINRIGAPAAWKNGFKGRGVLVAVVDTGVSPHQCFGGRVDYSRGGAFLGAGSRQETSRDANGHGTHVAGTIAGSEAFGFGVAPEATIIPVQVLDSEGVGNELDIIRGIDHAIDSGARVINMSLALVDAAGNPVRTRLSEKWHETVSRAQARNVAIVAATGNASARIVTAPSSHPPPGVLGIGSVGTTGARSRFSNFGAGGEFGAGGKPDLSAPGEQITSADHQILDRVKTMSGTSMATPHVAGALALLRSKNATMPLADLAKAIVESARGPGASDIGSGILDVAAAELKVSPTNGGGGGGGGGNEVLPNQEALDDLEARIKFWESKGIKRKP